MSNPFPGMNPYLEKPSWWKHVHGRLIFTLEDMINAQLPASFYVAAEERVYLSLEESAYLDIIVNEGENLSSPLQKSSVAVLATDEPLMILAPTEEVSEVFLEIRFADESERIIAAIEVLSPKNKSRESRGRDAYIAKQKQLKESEIHLIEIDLLRAGAYTLAAPYEEVTYKHPDAWHYGVCLHRGATGGIYEVWLSTVREKLPKFPIPLTEGFPDIVIDLTEAVSRVYEGTQLGRRIRYNREPLPPLSPEDVLWLDELLRGQGLRA